jgi:hypothetical protein
VGTFVHVFLFDSTSDAPKAAGTHKNKKPKHIRAVAREDFAMLREGEKCDVRRANPRNPWREGGKMMETDGTKNLDNDDDDDEETGAKLEEEKFRETDLAVCHIHGRREKGFWLFCFNFVSSHPAAAAATRKHRQDAESSASNNNSNNTRVLRERVSSCGRLVARERFLSVMFPSCCVFSSNSPTQPVLFFVAGARVLLLHSTRFSVGNLCEWYKRQ